MLDTILEVKEKYKADHIADILTGKTTAAVKSFRHDSLESFGSMAMIMTNISGMPYSGNQWLPA
jgi:hypothetical protein